MHYTVKMPKLAAGNTLENIINAGISAIFTSGIDRISVSQISLLSGCSRPTFYSYFGDTNGLLAEIWLARGENFLNNLTNPDFVFAPSEKEIYKETVALLEIFTVARRIPEVAEVVNPIVRDWWLSITRGDELEELRFSWFISSRIGAWLTYAIDQEALSSLFIKPLLLGLNYEDLHRGVEDVPKLETPQFKVEDPKLLLINSAIKAIATSGVAATSLTRIARNARVSSGAVYPRYKNIEEVVLDSFEHAISEVTRQNFDLITPEGFGPRQFGDIVKAGLDPRREIWRNYRVEMHLDARVSGEMRKKIKSALSATNAEVVRGLGQVPVPQTQKLAVAYLVHVIGIGVAILQNNGIDLYALNHGNMTQSLIAKLI